MQNMFATNQMGGYQNNQNFNTKQSVNQNFNTNSNIRSVNANDFSTMQQMFATNNNLYNFSPNTNSITNLSQTS
jgi:hypothetical protein